jgi:hypothetical protein
MFAVIPQFLRDPDAFFASVLRGETIRSKVISLSLSSALFLVIYGFFLGLSHSFWQALSSAVKMPLLLLVTVIFCLPALYFFSLALLSTRLQIMQVGVVVLTGVGVTSFLLLGLAPVTLFFVLTSKNYAFFQLLAVGFVALSGTIGLYYLWRGMTLVEASGQNGPGSWGRGLLSAWMVLYAFVASQMTWRLSPLVGDPTQPFILLQPSRDNFYVDAITASGRALGVTNIADLNGMLTGLSCLIPIGLALLVIVFLLGSSKGGKREGAAGMVRNPVAKEG